jgi:lysophospholipid acyltransferase (LPLAT)-like uncharacterized protein
VALGVLAKVWLRTLRVRVISHPAIAAASGRPWVLAFWHGKQWPLLAWKRRGRTVVMVSLSDDGRMQARALGILGLTVVRGSTSRGGARGLASLVREMRRTDADAAFAVDGPRGPQGRVKGGAVSAARATGAVLVPVTGVVHGGFVLGRAWDRFEVAWPLSRVDVVLGEPIDPAVAPDPRSLLETALARLNGVDPCSRDSRDRDVHAVL